MVNKLRLQKSDVAPPQPINLVELLKDHQESLPFARFTEPTEQDIIEERIIYTTEDYFG